MADNTITLKRNQRIALEHQGGGRYEVRLFIFNEQRGGEQDKGLIPDVTISKGNPTLKIKVEEGGAGKIPTITISQTMNSKLNPDYGFKPDLQFDTKIHVPIENEHLANVTGNPPLTVPAPQAPAKSQPGSPKPKTLSPASSPYNESAIRDIRSQVTRTLGVLNYLKNNPDQLFTASERKTSAETAVQKAYQAVELLNGNVNAENINNFSKAVTAVKDILVQEQKAKPSPDDKDKKSPPAARTPIDALIKTFEQIEEKMSKHAKGKSPSVSMSSELLNNLLAAIGADPKILAGLTGSKAFMATITQLDIPQKYDGKQKIDPARNV